MDNAAYNVLAHFRKNKYNNLNKIIIIFISFSGKIAVRALNYDGNFQERSVTSNAGEKGMYF